MGDCGEPKFSFGTYVDRRLQYRYPDDIEIVKEVSRKKAENGSRSLRSIILEFFDENSVEDKDSFVRRIRDRISSDK